MYVTIVLCRNYAYQDCGYAMFTGLQAVPDVAVDIRAGFYEIGKEHIPPKRNC